MKRTVFVIAACFLLFVLESPTSPQDQLQMKDVAKFPKPKITSVSQSYYALANNLVLNGTNFPPKVSGNVWRHIRLISFGSAGGGKGDIYFAGQTGNWTPTRVDDILPFEVQVGRKFRIGLVQFEMPNTTEKTLISNEVEFLVFMNLDSVTPSPVPLGTAEVEVVTANELGPQGSKIVKLGNSQAQVTKWGGPAPLGGKFKVRIPSNLIRPGTYDLWVEDTGAIVSRRIQVKLLGPIK
jgi:hypothetical protein